MARRLFFVPEVRNGAAELRGDDARHLSKVLRVERGMTYEISDNQQRWLAEVEASHKDLVRFVVKEKLNAEPLRPRITLALALIKFDHFEWALEKCTELGVAAIIPVECDRVEDGLERAAAKRAERWQRVLVESSQQCRRTFLPELLPLHRFADVLRIEATQRCFLDEERTGMPLASVAAAEEYLVLCGPEGGWTERERSEAIAAHWTSVSLGDTVLRAETAAMASVALLRR
jgi:16S rRNA (uracil1498-N3)-methyltransferase